MSAPFVWLYVSFAAGIIAGSYCPIAAFLVFLSIFPAALSLRAQNFRLAMMAQFFFFLMIAWGLTGNLLARYDCNTLRQTIFANQKDTLAVSGTIIRTPEVSEEFFILYTRIQSLAGKPVDGVARITVSGSMSQIWTAGDVIETYARFRLPFNFQTPGSFNYERYLKKEGIHALGSVKSEVLIHRIGRVRSLHSITSHLRLWLIQEIQKKFSYRDSDTLRALWLDDRSGLNRQTEQTLIDAGIFHVIAISGFHVAVIISLAFFAMKRFLNYRTALIVITVLLLFYFLLLEGRSSITRSFLTFLIFGFSFWRHEKADWRTVLFLSAFLQIFVNPLELFDSGYQLTYLSTAAIIFLAVPVARRIRLPRKIYQYPFDFLITALSIQFVLTPYQAFIFHKIPFASLLANFLAIPLSSVLIGLGSMVLPAVLFPRYTVWIVRKILDLFFANARLFSGIALKVVPTPSPWLLALFYGALLLFIVSSRKSLRIGCLIVCCLASFSILGSHEPSPDAKLRVHFIDVGQGDAILLQYPDGTADLVDGGGFWNPDALDVGTAILLPYLSALRVEHLHRVFLTHAHADHMQGLISLLNYIPADEFYVSRKPLAEPGFQQLIYKMPMPLKGVCKGQHFQQGSVAINVLAPEDAKNSLHVQNDDSLVLLIEFQGKRLMLPGDAEKATEESLCALPNLKVDFLKAAHHGSKTSSTREFVNKIKAKLVFISVGKGNWFGHPHPEVLVRFRQNHAMVYRTDQLGTLTLTIGNGEQTVQAFAWSH